MKYLCIITAIAATILVSCINEEPMPDNNNLRIQVNGIGTKSIQSTFAANDQINVFITGTGYTPTLTAYKYDGSAWAVSTAGTDIGLTGNNATVYAFYPLSLSPTPTLSSAGTLPISIPATDDVTATGTTDVLWATPVTSINNKTTGTSNLASLTFNHALSKVSFVIVKDATYPSATTAGLLGSISLTSAGNKIVNRGTTNLSTGVFSAGTPTVGSIVYTPAATKYINQAGDGTVTAYALMAPVNYSTGDLVLSVNIDGKTMSVSNFSALSDWSVANKNYIYTITVKPTGLTVTGSSSITDWSGTATGSNINSQYIVPQPESNCYMVTPGSTIYIPVSRAATGNAAIGFVATGGGTSAFSVNDSFTTGVLWSDVAITDRTATVVGQYIKVAAGAAEGNFVVYAMKGSSIVWSWHIWVSNYIPSATAKPTAPTVINGTGTIPYYGSQYWMDRNLGATTSAGNTQTSMGLYYQWGRKDPFPAANGVSSTTAQTIYLPQTITYPAGTASVTGDNTNVRSMGISTPITLANQSSYAVQYPLLFLTGWAGSTASAAADGTTAAGGIYSWCASDKTKTIFDPCPVGWRTPINTSYATSPWNSFGTSGGAYTGASWSSTLIGAIITSPAAAATFYPASGYRWPTSGALFEVSLCGLIWSCSINSSNGNGHTLYFRSGSMWPWGNSNSRNYGFNIRCVQE